MAAHTGVSKSTVQRLWAAHGIAPHRVHGFKLSNDLDGQTYRIMSYNGFHKKAVKLFLKFISHFSRGRWDRASIRTRYVGPCFDP